MKILFASSQWLYAETRFGGAKRLFALAQYLAQRHTVDLLCFDGNGEAESRKAPGIAPAEFNNILYLNLQKRSSRDLRNFTELPIEIPSTLEKSQGQLKSFFKENRYDASVLAYPLALSLLDLPESSLMGKTIYLEDDLFLETITKRIHQTRNPVRRLFRRIRIHQARHYYRQKASKLSGLIAISEPEGQLLSKAMPGIPLHILGYGLPLNLYPLVESLNPSPCVGFIGNCKHAPNLDAIRHLLQNIAPEIWRLDAGFKICVAGTGIPLEVRNQFCDSRIEYMDNFADLASFYRKIRIFVNPVLSGRGMRTKMIEAAAFGIPLVSTSLGAEGLGDLKIELAETPSEIAQACVNTAARSDASLQALRTINRQCIEANHSIESLGAQLEQWLSHDS